MNNDLVPSKESGAASSHEPAADTPGGPVTRDASPDVAARRAEIDRVRRSDIDRYFAEGLDKEDLQLLRAERGEIGRTEPLDPQEAERDLRQTEKGNEIANSWDEMGGFRLHLERVQEFAATVVRDAGDDRHQAAFMERFDRSFSDHARAVIYDEISTGTPSYAEPVSNEDLEHFGSITIGRELIEEWGPWAAEKVALLWARHDRLMEQLEDEAPDFAMWIDSLPPDEAKAVLRRAVQ